MYKMRNLPCRDAIGNEMKFAVCGYEKYALSDGSMVSGGGVLEWCYDWKDAMERLTMMKNDTRFFGLHIKDYR